MGTILNAANTPINVQTGSIPNVNDGMFDWFQLLTFEPVVKTTTAFQLIEVGDPINFWGVIQPFTDRELLIKPEGERSWTWLWLHAQPQLKLENDDVVLYLGVQTRVMTRKNYTMYGYVVYSLVQDWTGSGP